MSLISRPTKQKNQQPTETKQEVIKKEQEDDWDQDDGPGKSVIKIDTSKTTAKATVQQKTVQNFQNVGWELENKLNETPSQIVEGEKPAEPVQPEKPQPKLLNLNFRDREAGRATNNEGFSINDEDFFEIGKEPPQKDVVKAPASSENEPQKLQFTNSAIGADGKEKPLELDISTKQYLEKDSQIVTSYSRPYDPNRNNAGADVGKVIQTKGIKPTFSASNKSEKAPEEKKITKTEAEIKQEEALKRAEERLQKQRESATAVVTGKEFKPSLVSSQSTSASSPEKPSIRFTNSKQTTQGPIEAPLEQVNQKEIEKIVITAPKPVFTDQAAAPAETTPATTDNKPNSSPSEDKPQIPMFTNKKKNDENFVSIEKALLEAQKPQPVVATTEAPSAAVENKHEDKQKQNINRSSEKPKDKAPHKEKAEEQKIEETAVPNAPTVENEGGVEEDGGESSDEWNQVGGDQKPKRNGNQRSNKGRKRENQGEKGTRNNQKSDTPASTAAPAPVAPAPANTGSVPQTTNSTDQPSTAKVVVQTTLQTWDD